MTTDAQMHYFAMLSRDEQRAAIRRLANSGMSDYTIASITSISVEMVRNILAERCEFTDLTAGGCR